MSHSERPRNFLFAYSAFLILGAATALILANTVPDWYGKNIVHLKFFGGADHGHQDHGHDADGKAHHEGGHDKHGHEQHDEAHDEGSHDQPVGVHDNHGDQHDAEEPDEEDEEPAKKKWKAGYNIETVMKKLWEGPGGHGWGPHSIVNDLLMALFFAIAMKEITESFLPGGPMRNPLKAATPLFCTFGGVALPGAIFYFGAKWLGHQEMMNAWPIPCATDIAFSLIIARYIFGMKHPAIKFLMLLAIADDAAGLVIIAIKYPQGDPQYGWLWLSVIAMAMAFIMAKCRVKSFWWYLFIPGTITWLGFYLSGLHSALGLCPVIPLMPNAGFDWGIYVKAPHRPDGQTDTLNHMEEVLQDPVEVILGLFGLVNAGVAFSSFGPGTWLVLSGLLIGKPLGISICGWIANYIFRFPMPDGVNHWVIHVIGWIAAIGFTVALFVTGAAVKEAGFLQETLKMGALLSFTAMAIAPFVAWWIGIPYLRKVGDVKTEVAHS